MRATNTFKNRGSNAAINLIKSPQAASCRIGSGANAQRALDWCVVFGVLAIAGWYWLRVVPPVLLSGSSSEARKAWAKLIRRIRSLDPHWIWGMEYLLRRGMVQIDPLMVQIDPFKFLQEVRAEAREKGHLADTQGDDIRP